MDTLGPPQDWLDAHFGLDVFNVVAIARFLSPAPSSMLSHLLNLANQRSHQRALATVTLVSRERARVLNPAERPWLLTTREQVFRSSGPLQGSVDAR
eukprot:8156761-Pyramimonas_sp.AAC.1